jgi:hypothetical protein
MSERVRVVKSLPQGNGLFEREHVADAESDVATIDVTILVMGSSVYVIDTGNTYILNSLKVWRPM